MNRRSLALFVLVITALAGAVAWHMWGPRRVPAGQAALARLDDGNLDVLRADFNAHADKIRVIVLLSPT